MSIRAAGPDGGCDAELGRPPRSGRALSPRGSGLRPCTNASQVRSGERRAVGPGLVTADLAGTAAGEARCEGETPEEVVDAHHHLLDGQRLEYPWITGPYCALERTRRLEELRPHLAASGVSRTVVVQTMASEGETRWLLELAETSPEIAGVVGWVDLSAPDVEDALAAHLGASGGGRLVGIRHVVHDEQDPAWLLRPSVQRGLAAVGRSGLVYDLLVRERELPSATEAVRLQPELRFVLDHLGKPRIAAGARQPWERLVAALAGAGNVAAKVSGLVTEDRWDGWSAGRLRPYVDATLQLFGSDRLMLGSDWPVCELAGEYEDVWAAQLACLAACSTAERAAVVGATAARWYRLR